MKKLLQVGAILLGVLVAQVGFAAEPQPAQEQVYHDQDMSAQGCCPADAPCADQATNECWCKYVHYEPCYYTTRRCVEEQIPCKRKCCRYVDKYYEVQRCRMVPQYYTETCCRKEPEYYYVDECKTCKKWVCDQHCKYVPTYYWKRTCGDSNCTTPCPRGVR